MKKLLLTTALALAVFTAPADTFEPGVNANKTTLQEFIPVNTDYSNSGCQSLYTSDLLGEMYKVGADGTITAARIKSLSLDITFQEVYEGGVTDITVYLQNTDATSFEETTTKGTYYWMNYEDGCVGLGSITEDDMENVLYGETKVTVTVTFDTPFEYTGGSILMTWINDTPVETYYGIGDDSLYGFNPNNGVRSLYTGNNTYTPFETTYDSGSTKETSKYLPSITFEYETFKISNGPSTERGEATDFFVGNFEDPEIETGSTGDNMPFNGDYFYNGVQALYTVNELNGLNSFEDGAVTKAEISEITFLVSAQEFGYADMYYGTEYFETTVYIQNSDATEFTKGQDNYYHWLDFSQEHKGTAYVDFSGDEWEGFTEDYEGGVYPVTIHLEEPLLYEGNSLLVTFMTEVDCDEVPWVNGTAAVATSGIQAINKADDNNFDITSSGTAKSYFRYVPVLKLNYVPVTEKGGATINPVAFENVKLDLVANADVANPANVITVSFSLNDPANCGPYEIKAGTTSLGTISSTEGTISYVNIPVGDALTLNVVPAGENSIGVPYPIAKSEFDALFPAPEFELTKTAFVGFSYDLSKLPESVKTTGGAQFQLINWDAVPVSKFNWKDAQASGSADAVKQLRSDMEDLQAPNVNDYTNVQANKGIIAFSKANSVKASIDATTAAVTSFSGSLYTNMGIEYPVDYSTTPAIAEGEAEATVPAELKRAEIKKDYDNGNTYGKTQVSADFKSFTDPGKIKVDHPEIVGCSWNVGETYIKVFGPKETTLYHKKAGDAVAAALEDDDFTKHDNELPYLVLNHKENLGNTIHVQARNADGSVHSEIMFDVLENTVSGISNVTVDGSAEVEYFNLQGVRVANPENGLYIRRQGNTATKVLVK